MLDTLAGELSRRTALWGAIKAAGGPEGVPPDLLRNLNVYAGARGIYTDAETSNGLAPSGGAVTVSLLHTGKVYPDDLSADGLVYHYPVTLQVGKDQQEIVSWIPLRPALRWSRTCLSLAWTDAKVQWGKGGGRSFGGARRDPRRGGRSLTKPQT
jgi:hypothetical protein